MLFALFQRLLLRISKPHHQVLNRLTFECHMAAWNTHLLAFQDADVVLVCVGRREFRRSLGVRKFRVQDLGDAFWK